MTNNTEARNIEDIMTAMRRVIAESEMTDEEWEKRKKESASIDRIDRWTNRGYVLSLVFIAAVFAFLHLR